jgi:hypothetical protein
MINNSLINKLFKSDTDRNNWKYYLNQHPVSTRPVVTQNDARNGYLTRYFVRTINTKLDIAEVDEKQYETFVKNPRFVTTKLRWKIVGKKETTKTSSGVLNEGVIDINRQETANKDLTFGGLRSYIVDYGEFWFGESI